MNTREAVAAQRHIVSGHADEQCEARRAEDGGLAHLERVGRAFAAVEAD